MALFLCVQRGPHKRLGFQIPLVRNRTGKPCILHNFCKSMLTGSPSSGPARKASLIHKYI